MRHTLWQPRQNVFPQEKIHLQGTQYTEPGISFLVCKQKHMLKYGTPPDSYMILEAKPFPRVSSLWFMQLYFLTFSNMV